MDITKIENIQPITNSENKNSKVFMGKLNDNNIIIILHGIITNSFDLNKITDLSLLHNNDRFYKYICNNSIPVEISIIYPVLDDDYRKYFSQIKKVIETPEIYYNITYPKIINQNLTWINNIFNGTKEQESIIYSDDDIVFMPDTKWTSKEINNMYYLVIFKNKKLKSIRDLDSNHLMLLKRVKDICINKISELHNINHDQLRMYFHYHPSFWQLHLHINLITNTENICSVENCHLLSSVINNIELIDNYYQKSNIEVFEKINNIL